MGWVGGGNQLDWLVHVGTEICLPHENMSSTKNFSQGRCLKFYSKNSNSSSSFFITIYLNRIDWATYFLWVAHSFSAFLNFGQTLYSALPFCAIAHWVPHWPPHSYLNMHISSSCFWFLWISAVGPASRTLYLFFFFCYVRCLLTISTLFLPLSLAANCSLARRVTVHIVVGYAMPYIGWQCPLISSS